MTMQVQIYGDELDELYTSVRPAFERNGAAEYMEKRTESTPDYSKEPFTIVLLVLAIDKTIDIIKDIVEERRREKRETRYKISVDGGDPEEISIEELVKRLDALKPEG